MGSMFEEWELDEQRMPMLSSDSDACHCPNGTRVPTTKGAVGGSDPTCSYWEYDTCRRDLLVRMRLARPDYEQTQIVRCPFVIVSVVDKLRSRPEIDLVPKPKPKSGSFVPRSP
jgi:hypothetical protein